MGLSKLVGIKIVTKKMEDGSEKRAYMYYFQTDFTSYDVEHCDCAGVATCTEYSSVDLGLKIGDTGTLIYSKGYQDKAILTGFIPQK